MRMMAPGLAVLAGCSVVSIEVAAPASRDGAGAAAAGFTLPSQRGDQVALDDVLAGGPALLIFYRGAW